MTDDVIRYKSNPTSIDISTNILDTNIQEGLRCVWSGYLIYEYGPINFTWDFNWEQLKMQGIDGLTGHIIVRPVSDAFKPIQIDVDLKKTSQFIEEVIGNKNCYGMIDVSFEYYLIPTRSFPRNITQRVDEVSIDAVNESTKKVKSSSEESLSNGDIFLPSKKNNTILVVEAKLLYVNKAFLSYHSDFFDALFSSENNKEGGESKEEKYAIDDVTYEDFELLMRAIHPNAVFPKDESLQKLLELADRFKTSSVICQAEHNLLNTSKIENHKMLWMADKYGMPRLLEKTINSMDSIEKAKKLKASSEFEELSSDTKGRLFERLVLLI